MSGPAYAEPVPDTRSAWSVQGRLTLWISAGALALVLLSTVFSIWQTRDSLARELESLAIEEIAELSSECLRAPMTTERFLGIADDLNRHHPEFEIRSRAWSVEKERWIGDGGGFPRETLPTEGPMPEGFGKALPTPYQFVSTRMKSVLVDFDDDGSEHRGDCILELLLDGSRRKQSLEKAASLFLSVSLLIAAAMVVGGFVFARRLARMLSQVAESAGAARLDARAEAEAPANAPREIRAVTDAFRGSVSMMQEEHARNVLMTAGLAHELRSPLHNLMNEAEVALLRPRENDEYRGIVARQLHEMKEFALVVDNLITMTALRDTQHMERREVFDLGDVAAVRLQREEDLGDQCGVELVLQRSGDLVIAGDREALILMLRNLVGNAIRWTDEGTDVTVQILGSEDAVTIHVDDHGPGISETDRERIFEAFHQGEAPEGQRAGYGLGLALARAATTAHGGTISATAAPSAKGARFTVRIPRSSVAPSVGGAQPKS